MHAECLERIRAEERNVEMASDDEEDNDDDWQIR